MINFVQYDICSSNKDLIIPIINTIIEAECICIDLSTPNENNKYESFYVKGIGVTEKFNIEFFADDDTCLSTEDGWYMRYYFNDSQIFLITNENKIVAKIIPSDILLINNAKSENNE